MESISSSLVESRKGPQSLSTQLYLKLNPKIPWTTLMLESGSVKIDLPRIELLGPTLLLDGSLELECSSDSVVKQSVSKDGSSLSHQNSTHQLCSASWWVLSVRSYQSHTSQSSTNLQFLLSSSLSYFSYRSLSDKQMHQF